MNKGSGNHDRVMHVSYKPVILGVARVQASVFGDKFVKPRAPSVAVNNGTAHIGREPDGAAVSACVPQKENVWRCP